VKNLAQDVFYLKADDTKGWLSFKQMVISLSQIQELEKMLRPLYKEHEDLSTGFKNIKKDLEFVVYIRNKFASHSLQGLMNKTFEWRPETISMVSTDHETMPLLLNLFVLETAINTYVTREGKHKHFESNTDLVYQPDFLRFMEFVDTIVDESVEYLEGLLAFFDEQVEHVPMDDLGGSGAWFKAAMTSFQYLRKGKK